MVDQLNLNQHPEESENHEENYSPREAPISWTRKAAPLLIMIACTTIMGLCISSAAPELLLDVYPTVSAKDSPYTFNEILTLSFDEDVEDVTAADDEVTDDLTLSPTMTPITYSPTMAPTMYVPEPEPEATTPDCSAKDEKSVSHKGEKYCIRCPSSEAIVFMETEDRHPVCVLDDKGKACKKIEFDQGIPVCFDYCTKSATVHESGSPRCIVNKKGSPCKDIIFAPHKGVGECFDDCPKGAKHKSRKGVTHCVVNAKGKKCEHVHWSGTKPLCFDECKGRVEYAKGVPVCNNKKHHHH